MRNFTIRTDLALETREVFEDDDPEISGVLLEEILLNNGEIKKTTVCIETENGSRAMGKPKGTYITLEAPALLEPDDNYHREISMALSDVLKALAPKQESSILVVGLGNRNITPDALGPQTIDHLMITRHIAREFGKDVLGTDCHHVISGLIPGVMASTGMETSEIIRGVVAETHPALVIVIDALAARSIKRLNRTIQISDTGIHPGSGVGNHRNAINHLTLGVPVICIGIPTVVDAATIVCDSLTDSGVGDLCDRVLTPGLNTLFVTPKNVDESIDRLSFTLSEGINLAFSAAVFHN
ncbi:MAG: GPR endopeptidase [Lachnospiraceae bacterium]